MMCVCMFNHFAILSVLSCFWVKDRIKSIIVFGSEDNDNINKLRKAGKITYEQNPLITVEGIKRTQRVLLYFLSIF